MIRERHRAARLGALAQLFLKLFVSGGLIAVVIRNTDMTGIMDRLLDINVGVIIAAATFMAGLAALPAQRWKLLVQLGGREFSTATLYRLVMIGNFLGQAMPTIGADGVRAWYLYRHGIPLSAAINSVLLDRLSALAALLLLAFLTLPWLWRIVPSQVAWWTICLLLFAAMGALVLLIGIARLPKAWRRWRIVAAVQLLAASSSAVMRSPPVLLQVIGLSLTVHILVAMCVYALARAVHVPAGLFECILLIALVMLVATIPVGIAGWGLREGAM